jgi:hypothetical protein
LAKYFSDGKTEDNCLYIKKGEEKRLQEWLVSLHIIETNRGQALMGGSDKI